jgi:isoleucyl-tRNA synthetase
MDYSKTINLLKTEFPMRGNLPQTEPTIQAWWEEQDMYRLVQLSRKGKPKFILHDGPPYANGDIHIGHALNKILKDMIVRYKSLRGFDAPYVPGWDTHGLPIEQAITNSGKVNRKEMSVHAFRQFCAEYARDWVEKQKSQFKRLGIRGDWDHPYITLQPNYEAEQIRVFGKMVTKGYIYKGLRPVYWSPTSESALAEAEIEYKDKTSNSIYVAFPVRDGKGKLPVDAAIVIWTTTPWTLPANLGISLHPEYEYVLIEQDAKKYLVAQGLLAQVTAELAWIEPRIIASFKGAELDGMTCSHPWYDRASIVMVGEHVTLEAGTGCVHTAPGHGEDDFAIGQRYQIGVLCPVDDQGHFTAEAPGFEGMFYEKANKIIIDKLLELGLLLKQTEFVHQYPHDWRTKKPVIYRATEQWFASIDKFRQAMIEEIKKVNWTPKWGEIRLHNMIAERGDWCISRQRAWGVPIPIFYCRSCNEPLVNEQTIEHVASIFAQDGSDAWFVREERDLLPAHTICASCGHPEFRKETDIMDVWFDSGSSHAAALEAREELQWPADLYLEGSDQYRGWYNSSLITGVAVYGQSPYKGILSHGFTLDGEGRKMSKSLGNTVDPNSVCNKLGADILRLWVASVDYQSDVRISDHILTQTTEVYRKIRNTLRFLVGNLHEFDPNQHRVAVVDMNELDRYALCRLQRMLEKVIEAYDRYEFHVVYQTIHHFCAVEMSSFYLDVLKDRLYVEASEDPARRAAQTVLYDVLVTITKCISPILSHTADEIWRYIPGVEEISVQLSSIPDVQLKFIDEKLEEKWLKFLELRDEALKALEQARQDKIIGNSLGATLHLYPNQEQATFLAQFEHIEQYFIVSHVHMHPVGTSIPAESIVYGNSELKIVVQQAEGEKCERCWIVTPEVGKHSEHPTLCTRCHEVVSQLPHSHE